MLHEFAINYDVSSKESRQSCISQARLALWKVIEEALKNTRMGYMCREIATEALKKVILNENISCL